MNLTTTNIDLKDNQARTRKIDLNEFTIRGGILSYKSITVGISTISIDTVFFLYFSDPFLIEGLLHYIAPFGPS